MNELKTTMDSTVLTTTIGLEIHVQLKTKSKMFCRCDNEAFGAKPNTTVCPVCLGMPGVLPVANEQAILWTIKTGLALNCTIPKIAKFDRKHYFYPDLPKGYQISQYDLPFAIKGKIILKDTRNKEQGTNNGGKTIRITRVHLEEDAGKLIHANGKSLVDLNRAGTPLMEIVTEPDITSPEEAGAFMRELQKIVRDKVCVSEASMEKGHLRCDANISVTDGKQMSEIVELKNLNSFRFVEKALTIEEARLKEEYPKWPEKRSKVTKGYDSKQNVTFSQRTKEEASDYRYFPEPDLPPYELEKINLNQLKSEIGKSKKELAQAIIDQGVLPAEANILANNKSKKDFFDKLSQYLANKSLASKLIIHNYFGFNPSQEDLDKIKDYGLLSQKIEAGVINKQQFSDIAKKIHNGETYQQAFSSFKGKSVNLEEIVGNIIRENPQEVERYRQGKTRLLGFFVGIAMRESQNNADPKEIKDLLEDKLKN